MGDVLPFRPLQQPPQRGPGGVQPSGPCVAVVVHSADSLLAEAVAIYKASVALHAHAVAISVAVPLAVFLSGSHRHNPARGRELAQRRPPAERAGIPDAGPSRSGIEGVGPQRPRLRGRPRARFSRARKPHGEEGIMMTNGLDTVADQLKAAAEQYGNEAAELEQHAKTLRDKQARVRAAMAALAGGTIRTAPVDRRIFTAADDAYIRENWGAMRQSDIARHLGRTDGAVAARAKRRGLAAPRLSRASAAVSRPAEGARERTGTSLSTHPASATAPGFSL